MTSDIREKVLSTSGIHTDFLFLKMVLDDDFISICHVKTATFTDFVNKKSS